MKATVINHPGKFGHAFKIGARVEVIRTVKICTGTVNYVCAGVLHGVEILQSIHEDDLQLITE